MKKPVFILVMFLLLIITTSCTLSIFKQKTPEAIYNDWKFRLEHASKDSVTIRYKIQYQAGQMIRKGEDHEAIYYGIMGLQLAEADTSVINSFKREIVALYPQSLSCYEIAKNDFYDKIYPVWNDDHEKIIIIEKLLDKYPQTPWRRTMYQYLCYSLSNVGDREMLKNYLADWRNAFPLDYLPWYVSAANYSLMQENIDTTLAYAQKAYELSIAPQKPQYYPEMEWQLEERSAKINTTYTLADLMLQKDLLIEAETLLKESIGNNSLGVDDETTTCSLHYLLAKLYNKKAEYDKAIHHCCEALVLGDSRNRYSPMADSLLRQLNPYSTTLQTSRKEFAYSDVLFTDNTTRLGLSGVSGSRVAWGDYDNDGFQDFLLSGSRLFHNDNGKGFTNVTRDAFAGEVSFGGAIWADIDNDGDLDIVTKDPENIWLNSDNRFYMYSGSSDYKDNGVSSEGLAVGDISGDGILDIYLANYEGADNKYYHDELFIGRGESKFEEVTYSAGAIAPDDARLAGRGVNMGDYNNDGLLDIYVSNYRLTRNLLFENQGNSSFIEKAAALGIAGKETDGWWGHTIGSEWGDIDNDGDLDLVTCNLAHPRYIDFSNKTRIYINSGKPEYSFKDIRAEAGIRYEETNSEPSLVDFDNDGYLDLYITNVYSGRRSFLYMSNSDNTFRDVTWLSGTRHFNGWGAAACDYDNDGDMDLLVAGGEIQLFRNDTVNGNNWLQLEIEAARGNNIIGTRITLEGRGVKMIREIQGGKGTTNQHSMIQHFGLGGHFSGLTATIEYPSGYTVRLPIREVNNRYKIKEVK